MQIKFVDIMTTEFLEQFNITNATVLSVIKDQYPTYQPIDLFYDTHGMDYRVFIYKLVSHSHKVLSYAYDYCGRWKIYTTTHFTYLPLSPTPS